jgi:hypothetical protein
MYRGRLRIMELRPEMLIIVPGYYRHDDRVVLVTY